MSKAIGAIVEVKHIEDTLDDVETTYISFGEYDEETNADSYGVDDNNIYFYCDDEEELKKLMLSWSAEDFVVLSYELVYED